MVVQIRLLDSRDAAVLDRVAPGVFDDPVDSRSVKEFLADPRHHVVVAVEDGCVVGSVTGVHYVHPDKPAPELWINELAVAPSHRSRGLAKALLGALLDRARVVGCAEAWVLTDRSNPPALGLYSSLGGVEASRYQVMFTFHLNRDAGRRKPGRGAGPAEGS